MITQKKELTQDQQNQILKWRAIITTYEAKGEEHFSSTQIQEMLNDIQEFIRYGLPDPLFNGIKKVTDAIYEASQVLAEPQKSCEHYQQATRFLYLAIKELCGE